MNFTKKESIKFLFSDRIVIDGKYVPINVVETFQESEKDSVNICFNTVQGIKSSLNLLHEGRLDISDFENDKVVLIADEAHHLNTTTIKDKQENEDNQTWEDIVYKMFLTNKDNVLLEYTATCDLRDPNVEAKYKDKIIFNFRLKEFREAGYTKEFSNNQNNGDKFTRTLQALILSEFRKLMFESKHISIKPVVLLKSKTINDSKTFYDEFFEKLKSLDLATIQSIKSGANSNVFLANAFDFFAKNRLTDTKLIDLLKIDFSEEFSVNMNKLDPENENIVNNLDEKDNKYRLIFIVDKLTEGWDVLSLFDIVRLYDTRQGGAKGTVSKYTISEAQLIGRGARYHPFKFESDQVPEKRKYSNVIGTPEAICETLIYHCMQDSRYIEELKRALIETGLTPAEETIEVHYCLKDSFKKNPIYRTGYIFVNEKVEKSRNSITSLPSAIRNLIISFNCYSFSSQTGLLFERTSEHSLTRKEVCTKKMSEIDLSILYKSYRKFSASLGFDFLKSKFPNLNNIEEFLTSDSYLGNIGIIFYQFDGKIVTREDQLKACEKVMEQVSSFVSKIQVTYEGTKEFRAVPINEKITNLVRKYSKDRLDFNNGEGIPQNDKCIDEKYRYDVTDKDWYVFNNNYGTTEEKLFIKYFASKIDSLRKIYDKIYVIRNEKQVKVYSFENGEAFEPDFILLLIKKKQPKNLYLNIFVEAKGGHLLEKDSWKGEALKEFSKSAVPIVKFADDNDYKIWGTPLFNQDNTLDDFNEYFDKNFIA
ncbi:DEAD/DEAH box helicase family protein [Mycoplasmopsis caviae]|uniref:DEAD/DEAH box helicase family protein n=1 Tax=Mycoplasmopsis caviae TaxID=55603 RepID=A0ABY5J1K0_9BACT|nr:DEAD/DEAH box helicase family protein [Mycoplasmopsis caviae]